MNELVPKVETLEDALRPETIEWCNKQLSLGSTWDEVRHALGLGNSQFDKRWRLLRKELLTQSLPESPEEALSENYDTVDGYIRRLETQLAELDAELALDSRGQNKLNEKVRHHYYRVRADITNSLLEHRSRKFENYLGLRATRQKDREIDKNKGGVTIIIASNVPRPGIKTLNEDPDDNQSDE